jgi:hypothetical protein
LFLSIVHYATKFFLNLKSNSQMSINRNGDVLFERSAPNGVEEATEELHLDFALWMTTARD